MEYHLVMKYLNGTLIPYLTLIPYPTCILLVHFWSMELHEVVAHEGLLWVYEYQTL